MNIQTIQTTLMRRALPMRGRGGIEHLSQGGFAEREANALMDAVAGVGPSGGMMTARHVDTCACGRPAQAHLLRGKEDMIPLCPGHAVEMLDAGVRVWSFDMYDDDEKIVVDPKREEHFRYLAEWAISH